MAKTINAAQALFGRRGGRSRCIEMPIILALDDEDKK
jgi:hypothetical protein